MDKENFKVGGKGSIEENIERLQRELNDILVSAKGAPKINDDSAATEKKDDKKPALKKTSVASSQKEKTEADKKYVSISGYYTGSNQPFRILKSSKFYITFFGIVALGIILFKVPVFKYTTPFRQDRDLPQIEVGFRYSNNILGRQIRSVTVVKIGENIVTINLSMSDWVNMDKEKKRTVLKYYQE